VIASGFFFRLAKGYGFTKKLNPIYNQAGQESTTSCEKLAVHSGTLLIN
jgi:hypothetical protein